MVVVVVVMIIMLMTVVAVAVIVVVGTQIGKNKIPKLNGGVEVESFVPRFSYVFKDPVIKVPKLETRSPQLLPQTWNRLFDFSQMIQSVIFFLFLFLFCEFVSFSSVSLLFSSYCMFFKLENSFRES